MSKRIVDDPPEGAVVPPGGGISYVPSFDSLARRKIITGCDPNAGGVICMSITSHPSSPLATIRSFNSVSFFLRLAHMEALEDRRRGDTRGRL